ncbi:TPR repeat protein [Candidatus Thiomargarita nelsonii]|uniref:TPR repeat protein n=1 Tax=Candidatus Thiomargarita nelsonii TaxID=1003181 RepID=A0A176S341_9GAMM|nr:TPR repeat protein [Candidatus Thiomargarita nelsonii]
MRFKKWFIAFVLGLITFVVSAENQEEVVSPSSQATSFQAIVEKAERGDAEAQFNLGWMYLTGDGVTQNYIEAAKWIRKAAEQGDAQAQYNLGVMYLNGDGVTQNNIEAAKWIHKAAEQGQAYAQNELGVMYYLGKGVTQNDIEAANWFRKAAQQGNAQAQYNLGVMYLKGKGVTQNDIEAAKWYRKAAEQGHAGAYGSLGWLLITQGKFDEAQSLTEKAHQKQPQVFAWTINLGHIYLLKGDRQTARRYYQEALPLIPDDASFEQGPIADFELFIEKGWQVKACQSELEWIRSAFEQLKLAKSQDSQQLLVEEAQIDQDTFVVSAENQEESPELAETDDELVVPSAASTVLEKAEQGDAEAQYNLGVMYFKGKGVTQNDISATKWFRKAAKQGHAGAYGRLGWILITQGKFDEAQTLTEKAHQKEPQNLAWSINLGHIYLLKSDRQTARKYYQKALPLIYDDANLKQGLIADAATQPMCNEDATLWVSFNGEIYNHA